MNPDNAAQIIILAGAAILFVGWLFIPLDDIFDVDLAEDDDDLVP